MIRGKRDSEGRTPTVAVDVAVPRHVTNGGRTQWPAPGTGRAQQRAPHRPSMRPYPLWLSQWPPLSCWREQWGPAPEPQRGRQHWPCPMRPRRHPRQNRDRAQRIGWKPNEGCELCVGPSVFDLSVSGRPWALEVVGGWEKTKNKKQRGGGGPALRTRPRRGKKSDLGHAIS